MSILQNSLRFRVAGWLGAAFLRALHATWRVECLGLRSVQEGARAGSVPAIVAFWHRHILSMLSHYRGYRVVVPVSEHRDGEYVAQVMERFGLASVRGSTTHGSLKLLRGMVAMAEAGYSPAITPDGPRGPKFSVQPGIYMLARRSGLPVHPIGVAVRNAWTARSWDDFVIPKPFTRIAIVMGPPLNAGDFESGPAFCAELRRMLFSVTEAARRAARPCSRSPA